MITKFKDLQLGQKFIPNKNHNSGEDAGKPRTAIYKKTGDEEGVCVREDSDSMPVGETFRYFGAKESVITVGSVIPFPSNSKFMSGPVSAFRFSNGETAVMEKDYVSLMEAKLYEKHFHKLSLSLTHSFLDGMQYFGLGNLSIKGKEFDRGELGEFVDWYHRGGGKYV